MKIKLRDLLDLQESGMNYQNLQNYVKRFEKGEKMLFNIGGDEIDSN